MGELPEYVDGLPNLCGSEQTVEAAIAAGRHRRLFPEETSVGIAGIDSAFAVALHMHQPLIPAGGDDLRTAAIISNLQWMLEHPDVGDNHNAPVFHWCYKRMGEFIPQLLGEGNQPRMMLEYSGTLLHGLRQMGLDDVFDALGTHPRRPDPRRPSSGSAAPGATPSPRPPRSQDYRLHVRAWQHHFAAIFGLEALGRVRGFSPAEMALPNHPDVAYAFVRTLTDCGYEWVLVQEHTVEQPDGRGVGAPASAAPAGLHQTRRGETAEHHRGHQDPGQRHQAGRPDAALLRGQGPGAAWSWPAARPAAGHPDRRRRERRRHDERVPAQVPRGDAGVLRGRRTPAVNVTEYLKRWLGIGVQPRGPAGHPAAAPAPHLGADSSPATAPTGSPPSSASCAPRTTASTWRAAAGPTTSPGCAATTTC